MAEDSKDLDPQAPLGASKEITRMAVASAVAVILLAGGVYWLRHVPAQIPALDSGAATIQVRLLQVPEPTPYPVAADAPMQAARMSVASRAPDEMPREANPADDQPVILETPPAPNPPAAEAVRVDTAIARSATRDRALKFQQALQRHIARYQRFPADARERGLGGTVEIVFLLRRDGSIADAWVKSTSGQSVLDREALATIRRAEPLPTIPSDLPDELSVSLPVAFELR